MLKTCEQCGKEFLTHKTRRKFCSVKCSSQNQCKKIEKVCEYCNKSFLTHSYRKDTIRFCSNKCREIALYHLRVKISCCICGKEFKVLPFESKRKLCSLECRNEFMKTNNPAQQDAESIYKRLQDAVGDEYSLLTQYTNMLAKVEIRHNKCNNVWETTLNGLLNSGKRCPKCQHRSYVKTTEEYAKEVELYTNSEYELIGQYISNKKKVTMMHNKCGFIWEQAPSSILQGYGCPKCKESKGEQKVRRYLESSGLNLKTQYRIEGCRYKRTLPFDFALFNLDNQLFALIEYQGEQHYRTRRNSLFKMDEKRFLRDEIKRKFCKDNKIPLIEIPYTVSNVHEYLNKALTMLIPSRADNGNISEGVTTRQEYPKYPRRLKASFLYGEMPTSAQPLFNRVKR